MIRFFLELHAVQMLNKVDTKITISRINWRVDVFDDEWSRDEIDGVENKNDSNMEDEFDCFESDSDIQR